MSDPLDDFIEPTARMLGLPIAADWNAAVRANLAVIFQHAQNVADFPLPDEAEPAPVFVA